MPRMDDSRKVKMISPEVTAVSNTLIRSRKAHTNQGAINHLFL